ncbi:ErfK/YbiS/YcfS/YnhG [hydrothermal vent metagenome]|uniref:ErfK/YbiS/YcfS/YnhG n=1 Tax=hydrothermal vent metagenome TaxID=652676 RepID=A0A3B0TYC8_9ZZZZ
MIIRSIRAAILLLIAALFSVSLIAPASAARVYNADTNKWEDSNAKTGSTLAKSYARKVVDFKTDLAVGSVLVDTSDRWLYLIQENGKALRYGVGVGREGFQWSGRNRISRKAEWPGWTPPAAMRKRQPGLPAYMPGGPDNPLGARAMYIGSTLYRLHGTSDPNSIGRAVSSGCIRLMNDDVIDLYERVRVGALVVVQD